MKRRTYGKTITRFVSTALLAGLLMTGCSSAGANESGRPQWIAAKPERKTQWIWPEGIPRARVSEGERKFRHRFDVREPGAVKSAVLQVASYTGFSANLNGNEVGSGGPSSSSTSFDVAELLEAGMNRLEVATVHDGKVGRVAGVAAELVIEWANGHRETIRSGRSWLASTDDGKWHPVKELGDADGNPWNREPYPGRGGPMPMFRKAFGLTDRPVDTARVTICGLGHFELSINGQKVGDHVLDPPWSDYADTCYSVTFDVSQMLRPGENAIGVMLGNGMFNVRGGRYTKFIGSYGEPILHLSLQIDQGGRETSVVSDGAWKTDDGPIRFSCIYGGEDFDAREEQAGWDEPGFDDGDWKAVAVVEGPGGRVTPASSPPIKVVRHLDPVSVTRLPDGRYEVDLGENLSSRPTLTVKGKRGAQVTVETAEFRGKPWPGHSYTYTLKGGPGPESFVPRFSYFSFQYLYISGVVWGDDVGTDDSLPELVDIGADFISSSGPRIGSFVCANPLLNEIDAMIDRSVASNLQHVLTDCPHREKLGWLEVSHLMGPSILLNYDMGELYRKICRDTTDSQLENGLIPDIAPEFVRFIDAMLDSPEWGSASVRLPWLIHQWYGDERILREQYPTMARYTDYLASTRNEAGLVKGGLGDWYDWTPEKGHAGRSQLTPPELPATCMLYDNARILRQAATMQGKAAETRKWKELSELVRRDFLAAYYDERNQTVATGSQSALALGLYFDLVPTEDRDAVLANLVRNLETSQYRQSTGEVCFRYLVLALAEAGRSDVVYRMINRTDAPGYGCMLRQHGLKTLSERWDRPGSSLNHCMFGHIQEWFQKYLLGIRQAPGSTGYEKVLIDPFFPDDLQWAKGSFDSPNGRIEVAWKRKDGRVEVTVNAEKAEVIVPRERKDIQWKD